VGQLEKRLKAEQDARAAAEKLLAEEKKRKKLEEATAARAVALAAATRCFPSFHNIRYIIYATLMYSILLSVSLYATVQKFGVCNVF